MSRHILLSIAVFCTCSLAHVSGANIVANGSFEQGTFGIGTFQGWQTNPGDTFTFVDSSGKTGPFYGEAFDGLWAPPISDRRPLTAALLFLKLRPPASARVRTQFLSREQQWWTADSKQL